MVWYLCKLENQKTKPNEAQIRFALVFIMFSWVLTCSGQASMGLLMDILFTFSKSCPILGQCNHLSRQNFWPNQFVYNDMHVLAFVVSHFGGISSTVTCLHIYYAMVNWWWCKHIYSHPLKLNLLKVVLSWYQSRCKKSSKNSTPIFYSHSCRPENMISINFISISKSITDL